MTSERDDLIELFDFAWNRLLDRMDGLSKAEWMWSPTADDRISLHWRLDHITAMLAEERNWVWLGAEAPSWSVGPSLDPGAAIQSVTAAYAAWRDLLMTLSDDDLAEPIGADAHAGPYAESTRRSLVLHLADEFVHHGAEAALLRDLYAGTTAAG